MPVSLASSSAAAMHGAMVPIASVTFSSNNSAYFFTNIPQVYQDLMLVISQRGTSSGTRATFFGFNNLSASNTFSYTQLISDGSSATSVRNTSNQFQFESSCPLSTDTAGVFSSVVINILNYRNSSTFKSVLFRSAADFNGSGFTTLAAGLWQNTSAIDQINIRTGVATGSTYTLYGIRTVGQ